MKKLNTLQDRVKYILFEKNLTLRDVAEALNCSFQSVAYITKGHTKSPRKIVELSKFLGVSVEYLLHGEESKELISEVGDKKNNILFIEKSETDVLLLPSHEINHGAHKRIEEMETKLPASQTYSLRVTSNAMYDPDQPNNSLREGDLACVEQRNDWQPGDTVVVRLSPDELKIRKISRDGTDIILHSMANFQYPSINLTKNMEIIGIVVGLKREVLFKK